MTKKISTMAKMAKELFQYKAMDLMALSSAYRELKALKKKNYMASGIVVTLQNLEGTTIVGPVMIADGVSQDFIDSFLADVQRTYEHRLSMNQCGPRTLGKGEE